MKLTLQKLEVWGYRMVKFHNPNLQPFLTDPPVWRTPYGRTKRRTDGRGHNI